MTTLTWDRHRGHAFTYDVARVGTNARMDEIRAAIGRIQLRKVLGANARRAEVVRWYREGVRARGAALAGLAIPFSGDHYGEGSHHLFVVLLPRGSDRERVMTSLREAGVQTSIHYPPTHRFTAYASTPSGAAELPRTDAAFERLLTLPLGPSMTRAQVDLVLDSAALALR
jgi:dTDP-4-amino-4,6-dideoxygalactose transaminase